VPVAGHDGGDLSDRTDPSGGAGAGRGHGGGTDRGPVPVRDRQRQTGFDEVYVNQIGPDQDAFFEFYAEQVLPKLR